MFQFSTPYAGGLAVI